jgi:peptidoglycan/LPS O-acetylase OafA/YrhL
MTIDRLVSLDGLRGLAIILVVCFHAYAMYPDLIPWTTIYRDFFIFKFGWLGVELFFLISGFVIYLTLQKCKTLKEFIYRRWIRLFPAMLIGSVIIYISAIYLPERPNGMPNFVDLFPGLLFIHPEVLKTLFDIEVKSLENVFWSLFVEVKFYLMFGSLYFYNKSTVLRNSIILFLMPFFCHLVTKIALINITIPSSILTLFYNTLSLQYFGWFIIGALLYQLYSTDDKRINLIALLLLAATIDLTVGIQMDFIIACLCVYMIFYLAIFNKKLMSVFKSNFFVFFGYVSYPLYLIHESIMIALTVKTHRSFPFIPDLFTPIPGLVMIISLCLLILKFIEPMIRKLLRYTFERI